MQLLFIRNTPGCRPTCPRDVVPQTPSLASRIQTDRLR